MLRDLMHGSHRVSRNLTKCFEELGLGTYEVFVVFRISPPVHGVYLGKTTVNQHDVTRYANQVAVSNSSVP